MFRGGSLARSDKRCIPGCNHCGFKLFMVNDTLPWNVAPFKKPARIWWDMAILAWDMVIERSPPRLAAPLSGARLERDVWFATVLNPRVDRGPGADTPGKGCSWRNAPPVPQVHVAPGLWTAGWVADCVNISDRFAGTPCVCSTSLILTRSSWGVAPR